MKLNTSHQFAKKALFGIGAAACALSLAGCGGSRTSSEGNTFVRVVNELPNGGSATINGPGILFSNVGSFGGFSSYTFETSGSSIFSFSLTAQPTITYPNQTVNLVGGDFYTAILVGRSDITSTSDPRYPKLVFLTDDRTVPAVNDVRIRTINSAPDQPSVDVYINGQKITMGEAYGTGSTYANYPSGSVTVSFDSPGTTTVLATQVIPVSTPGLFSIILTEPTVGTTDTYAIQTLQDG